MNSSLEIFDTLRSILRHIMGIKSLLPQLQDITVDIDLRNYQGKKVGVDAYVWLHQKVYSCATELCLQKPTKSYVRGFIKEVQLLLRYGVVPVIVFDGDDLPSKANVHKKRAHSRNRHFEEGLKQYQEGNRGKAASHF
eukprot:303257_1